MRIALMASPAAWLGGLALSLAMLLSASQCAARAEGVVPEGMWVLNQARSHKLMPAAQTLWVIRDDGVHLVWASVETDPHGRSQVITWNGVYGGPPVAATGSGFLTRITSSGPGSMQNSGEIPSLGKYKEDCRVSVGGKRMICNGRVEGAQGVRTWLEDFDWVCPSPTTPPSLPPG